VGTKAGELYVHFVEVLPSGGFLVCGRSSDDIEWGDDDGSVSGTYALLADTYGNIQYITYTHNIEADTTNIG
jgi:hypothetical protein